MSQELTVVAEALALRAPLQELLVEFRHAHQCARECAAQSVENMVRAGQAIRKLRDLCDEAEWNSFLQSEFGGSERTAQRYMYLAKHWPLTLRSAI